LDNLFFNHASIINTHVGSNARQFPADTARTNRGSQTDCRFLKTGTSKFLSLAIFSTLTFQLIFFRDGSPQTVDEKFINGHFFVTTLFPLTFLRRTFSGRFLADGLTVDKTILADKRFADFRHSV
jgi:hypothetical protein